MIKNNHKNCTHGFWGTTTYVSWNNMKNRCDNSSNPKSVKNYLSKGITYCPEWKDFSVFLKDMGLRPSGTSLDRIDGTKGYYKGNCRWATISEQNRNRKCHTNTGHKYITFWDNYFIVSMKPFGQKKFKDKEEAINYKNKLLNLKQNNFKLRRNSMIVDQITYTKRMNEGNYNYSELTVTASLEEKDSPLESFEKLKALVHKALTSSEKLDYEKEEVESSVETKNDPWANVSEVKSEEAVVADPAPQKAVKKKSPAKKKVEEVKEEVVVVEETKTNYVKYNRDLDAHRQLLSSYLTKSFPTWKSKSGLKDFSLSLSGKDFLDENGLIIDSFKTILSDFFNA